MTPNEARKFFWSDQQMRDDAYRLASDCKECIVKHHNTATIGVIAAGVSILAARYAVASLPWDERKALGEFMTEVFSEVVEEHS